MGDPVLKQPILDWKSQDKYLELCYLEIIAKSIFLTNSYNIEDSKEVPIIMNWLAHEGLRFLQILSNTEQEKCISSAGLFQVVSEMLKLQINETTVSLQYCNLKIE